MAKILAVEWERGEARVAVADRRGKRAVIEQLVAVPLPEPTDNGQLAPHDLGRLLAQAVGQNGGGAAERLVAVGRAGVELRELSLPPVPDEELPEVVRFQATRQFSSLSDQSALDYLPLHGDATQPRQVLAAALSAAQFARIEQTLDAAQMRPTRIVLRPCAAASLAMQSPETASCDRYLVLHLCRREVDMVAVAEGRIVLIRTALLPAENSSEAHREALIGEVRRTLAAVHNQFAGQRLSALVVCGDSPNHQALVKTLGSQFDVPAFCIDPYTRVELAGALRSQLPDEPGRYAALLAMVADQCAGVTPAIDFVNPRKVPEPPKRGRMLAMVGLALLALLLAVGGLTWMKLQDMDRKIDGLKGELADLEEDNESLEQVQRHAEQLDGWVAADPNWLEEFYRLAERFPEVANARLTRLEIRSLESNIGHMYLKGFADQPETISKIEESLRDEYRHVYGRRSQMASEDPSHRWSFDATVEFHVPAPDPLRPEQQEAAKVAGDGQVEATDTDAADRAATPPSRMTSVMARPEGTAP